MCSVDFDGFYFVEKQHTFFSINCINIRTVDGFAFLRGKINRGFPNFFFDSRVKMHLNEGRTMQTFTLYDASVGTHVVPK